MTEYILDIEAVKREREAMQDDIAECMRIIGLGDHARPGSPHLVMQEEVIPKIKALVKLRDGLLRKAEAEARTQAEAQWRLDDENSSH